MAYILYESGKKIGEISEWVLTERPAEQKIVLGKEVSIKKPHDECTFVSPKPIHRKGQFSILIDHKIELVLKTIRIKDGTFVTATILEKRNI